MKYFYVITIAYGMPTTQVNRTSVGLVDDEDPASRYSHALKNVCGEAHVHVTQASTLFYHIEKVEV